MSLYIKRAQNSAYHVAIRNYIDHWGCRKWTNCVLSPPGYS